MNSPSSPSSPLTPSSPFNHQYKAVLDLFIAAVHDRLSPSELSLLTLLDTTSSRLTQEQKRDIDCLLRSFYDDDALSKLIPYLRSPLGQQIDSDDRCIEALISLQTYLSPDDKKIVDDTISFLKLENSDNYTPEKLLTLVDRIPIEKCGLLLDCCQYIILDEADQ